MKKLSRDEIEQIRRQLVDLFPTDQAVRLLAHVDYLRDTLEEIAHNCEGLVNGGLPHFTRRDIADAVACRARVALA